MFQTTNQMSIPTIIRRSSPTLQIRFKWAEERLPVSQLSASDDSDDLFFLWRFKKWPDKLCSGHLVCCSKAKAFGGRPAKHTIPIPEAHVDKEWQLTFLPNCSQIPSICVKLTVLHSATKAWARLWMDAGNSVMALLPQESDCKPAVHLRLRDNIENKNTNNIKKNIPSFPLVWDLCLHAWKLALFFLTEDSFLLRLTKFPAAPLGYAWRQGLRWWDNILRQLYTGCQSIPNWTFDIGH